MLEILKYGAVYLAANIVSCSCVFVPASSEPPIRALQLKLLYRTATSGPGGFDDSVQAKVLSNPAQYALGIAHLLKSDLGSEQQQAGLYFAEYVTDNTYVRRELEGLLLKLKDEKAKQFVAGLLASAPSRPPSEPQPTIKRVL